VPEPTSQAMPVRARKAVKIKPNSRRTNGKAEKFFDIF
jgi:hypothetical protein